MFNWNDLVFFLELARHGRLMPAARRLRVDYTTVSRRVSELEKDLAVTLFERKSDGFILTQEGHQLFAVAERIEAMTSYVDQSLKSSDDQPSGRVRIATMEGIAVFYLTERFREFNEIFPEIAIELITERYLVNLTKREADLFISFVPPIGPRLKVRKSGEFGLGLFASADYLQRKGKPGSKEELMEHDFVDYVPDLVSIQAVRWLRDVLDPENVTFRSTSMAAQQNAVAAGYGLGLLPFFSAKRDARLVPVLSGEVQVQRDIYISVHEDIEYLGRIKSLTKFLSDTFERDFDYLNRF